MDSRSPNPSAAHTPSNDQHPQQHLPCHGTARIHQDITVTTHTASLPTSAANPGANSHRMKPCPISHRPPQPVQLLPKRTKTSCSCNQLIAKEKMPPGHGCAPKPGTGGSGGAQPTWHCLSPVSSPQISTIPIESQPHDCSLVTKSMSK